MPQARPSKKKTGPSKGSAWVTFIVLVLCIVGLVAKAQAGTIKPTEAGHLRNLLRDNGMYLGLAPEGAEKSDMPRNVPVDLPSFGRGDRYDN